MRSREYACCAAIRDSIFFTLYDILYNSCNLHDLKDLVSGRILYAILVPSVYETGVANHLVLRAEGESRYARVYLLFLNDIHRVYDIIC